MAGSEDFAFLLVCFLSLCLLSSPLPVHVDCFVMESLSVETKGEQRKKKKVSSASKSEGRQQRIVRTLQRLAVDLPTSRPDRFATRSSNLCAALTPRSLTSALACLLAVATDYEPLRLIAPRKQFWSAASCLSQELFCAIRLFSKASTGGPQRALPGHPHVCSSSLQTSGQLARFRRSLHAAERFVRSFLLERLD